MKSRAIVHHKIFFRRERERERERERDVAIARCSKSQKSNKLNDIIIER